MTNQEKYDLITSQSGNFFYTADMIFSNSIGRNSSILNQYADSISKNSCSTYINHCWVDYVDGAFEVKYSTYNRYDNSDIDKILARMENVVLIVDNKGETLWSEKSLFEKDGVTYYLLGRFLYSGQDIEKIIEEDKKIKELTDNGRITLKGKQFTIKQLENMVDLIEKIKSLY